jgi:hypothetical protein
MAAFTKFFVYTPDGSMALAAALGVGRGALGALLAAFTMGGALFSHATKIGWSGNAAAEMWPIALLVLVAAAFVFIARRARL